MMAALSTSDSVKIKFIMKVIVLQLFQICDAQSHGSHLRRLTNYSNLSQVSEVCICFRKLGDGLNLGRVENGALFKTGFFFFFFLDSVSL